MTIIVIDNYVSLHQGITSEEGEPIFNKIIDALSRDDEVTLDFDGMKFLTTAFLNVMIGALYKDYTSEQLQKKLHIKNINEETAARVKKVTDNAKSFYGDQEKFNDMIDSSIYGNV